MALLIPRYTSYGTNPPARGARLATRGVGAKCAFAATVLGRELGTYPHIMWASRGRSGVVPSTVALSAWDIEPRRFYNGIPVTAAYASFNAGVPFNSVAAELSAQPTVPSGAEITYVLAMGWGYLSSDATGGNSVDCCRIYVDAATGNHNVQIEPASPNYTMTCALRMQGTQYAFTDATFPLFEQMLPLLVVRAKNGTQEQWVNGALQASQSQARTPDGLSGNFYIMGRDEICFGMLAGFPSYLNDAEVREIFERPYCMWE